MDYKNEDKEFVGQIVFGFMDGIIKGLFLLVLTNCLDMNGWIMRHEIYEHREIWWIFKDFSRDFLEVLWRIKDWLCDFELLILI